MQQKPRAIDIGAHFESRACEYLQRQGLRLIAKNYRTKMGEIDLIMQDGNVLVFVEVRYRQQTNFGSSAESITYQKQRKLIKAINHYLLTKRLLNKVDCRIDVVAIDTKASQQLKWIKNAF